MALSLLLLSLALLQPLTIGRHRKDLRIAFRYFALATASGAVLEYLGASGGDLGASGGNLGASGGNLGASGGDLGASGGDLGLSGGSKPSGDSIDLPQFIAFAKASSSGSKASSSGSTGSRSSSSSSGSILLPTEP